MELLCSRRLHFFDRTGGVKDAHLVRMSQGLGPKSVANALLIIQRPAFQPVGAARSAEHGDLRRQVEYQGQIRLQAIRDHVADLPKQLRIEAAGVALVHHVGE